MDQVADALRQRILAGGLPPGTPLREVALAEALQVSRNTVREAVRSLVSEGLLVHSINRGVSVRAVSPADVRDIFAARGAIEVSALQIRRQADPGTVSRAQAAVDHYEAAAGDNDLHAVMRHDLEFHRAVAAMHGSARLSAAHEGLLSELRLASSHFDRERPHLILSEDHQQIWALWKAGRRSAAAQRMAAHLRDADAQLSSHLARSHAPA